MAMGIGKAFASKKQILMTQMGAIGKSNLGRGALGAMNKITNWMARSNKGKSIPNVGSNAKSRMNNVMDIPHNLGQNKLVQKVKAGANVAINHPTFLGAQALVGFSAMASLNVLSGGMSRANDIMAQRYMRDSRYSSRMSAQTNLGKSMGNSRINIGNHTGLSLALHSGRHG